MRNKAATDTTDKAKLEAFSNILAAITCEFYNYNKLLVICGISLPVIFMTEL